MNQAFEKLDKSMKDLCLELIKYREDDPHYQQALSELARQYQACNTLMALSQDNINNIYYSLLIEIIYFLFYSLNNIIYLNSYQNG